MSQALDHVNVLLSKLRQDAVTDLSSDSSSEAYKALVAVNRAIARVWNAKTWAFKRRTSTFATVASTGDYELPKDVGEPYSVISSLYPYKIQPVPKHLFDLYVPNITDTGNPRVMVLSDQLGVNAQPPITGAPIFAFSSSAADTSQTVLIKGIVGGEEEYEEIPLAGVTPSATVNNFTHILSVTKSAATLGRISITLNGGSVIVVLGRQEKTAHLRKATLYPTPSAVATITIYHFALPPVLTHRYEDALIPHRWDYVVDQWAFAFGLQAKGQDQSAEFANQVTLADSLLKEDMKGEETISIEEPIIPLKAGEGGSSSFLSPPAGMSFVEGA